jgi:hypothetical protein
VSGFIAMTGKGVFSCSHTSCHACPSTDR